MAFLITATMYLSWIEIIFSVILCIYLLTFLLVFIGWQKLPEIKPDKLEEFVTVSVIVAARNESNTLPHLLNDLFKQEYPDEYYDIIIIDDHSDQPVSRLNEVRFYKGNNLKVFELPKDKQGKKQALLEGIKKSSSELILFTDADCQMEPLWIYAFAREYIQNSPELIIGLTDYESKPGFLQGFFRTDLISLVISGAGTASLGHATLCNGANLAVRRDSFNRYASGHKMHISSGDDVYLLHAIKKHSRKAISVLKSKNAVVHTSPPENIREFLNQRIRWSSKGINYSDTDTIFLALVVYLTNLVMLLSLVFCLFDLLRWHAFFILLAIKIFANSLVLIPGFQFFGRMKKMYLFPVYEMLYPFYAVITPIMGIFKTYTWKGRKGKA